jgi:hypothetical protein
MPGPRQGTADLLGKLGFVFNKQDIHRYARFPQIAGSAALIQRDRIRNF